MLEIDEGIGRPEPGTDFFASHNFPGATQQHFKDQVRLTTKSYFCSALGKLARTRVYLERAKAVFPPRTQRTPAATFYSLAILPPQVVRETPQNGWGSDPNFCIRVLCAWLTCR